MCAMCVQAMRTAKAAVSLADLMEQAIQTGAGAGGRRLSSME
jgi:hypothetical protein